MSFSKSPLAFDDIREAFDRALAAEHGIRIACKNRGAAVVLRTRFNYYRALNRKENKQTYTADHHLYGHSVYDRLVCKILPKGDPNEHFLYIVKRSSLPSEDVLLEEVPSEDPTGPGPPENKTV